MSADDVKEEGRKLEENYSGLSIFFHAFIHSTLFEATQHSPNSIVVGNTMYKTTEVVPAPMRKSY